MSGFLIVIGRLLHNGSVSFRHQAMNNGGIFILKIAR